MIDPESRSHNVRRLAASLQAIARVLTDLTDGKHADLVISAIGDPLSVRTAVERYERSQGDIGMLQKHIAQILDLREHVTPETDIYERFKNIDEQVLPRLVLKVAQWNMDRVEIITSSRTAMLRLRALLCDHIVRELWDAVPSTWVLPAEAAAEIGGHVKSVVRQALSSAGRLFEADLSPDIENFIDQRVEALLVEILRRITGATLPSTTTIEPIAQRVAVHCREALVRAGYRVESLAGEIDAAAGKAGEMVCEVARGGAVLTFPMAREPYDPARHDAKDEPSGTAVVTNVTFPGLRRGERVLQLPQVITGPAPQMNALSAPPVTEIPTSGTERSPEILPADPMYHPFRPGAPETAGAASTSILAEDSVDEDLQRQAGGPTRVRSGPRDRTGAAPDDESRQESDERQEPRHDALQGPLHAPVEAARRDEAGGGREEAFEDRQRQQTLAGDDSAPAE